MDKKYYGYYTSPIGILEIVSSDKEILSVMFVEREGRTRDKMEIINRAVIQLDEYFKGIRKEFDLEFKLEGTDFQRGVWKELMNISYGRTLSYKELATKIGNEKAVRAVGNANGKNIISIIVPCHRVIGWNKSLTGYAWGLERKKWLLEHEKSFL